MGALSCGGGRCRHSRGAPPPRAQSRWRGPGSPPAPWLSLAFSSLAPRFARASAQRCPRFARAFLYRAGRFRVLWARLRSFLRIRAHAPSLNARARRALRPPARSAGVFFGSRIARSCLSRVSIDTDVATRLHHVPMMAGRQTLTTTDILGMILVKDIHFGFSGFHHEPRTIRGLHRDFFYL